MRVPLGTVQPRDGTLSRTHILFDLPLDFEEAT